MSRRVSVVQPADPDEFADAVDHADQMDRLSLPNSLYNLSSAPTTPTHGCYLTPSSFTPSRLSPAPTPSSLSRCSSPLPSVSLDVALEDCRETINLFLDNKFDEVKDNIEDWNGSNNFYHALGKSVFAFLQAVLTFQQSDMEAASEIVKISIDKSNKYRRKNTLSESFGRMLKKTDYNVYTEEQIHAELCYAESLLLKAVLTFTEDENLVSFVRGGLKIRSCYQSYKECWNILNQREWENDEHKVNFESGVRLGVGSFNLLISLLPQRILKLLEFIGFTGTREIGLKELAKGYQFETSVRRSLCAMVLLGYHLLVVYVLGNADGDLVQASAILDDQLKINPNGVWFLFFKGRLEMVQGNIPEAIMWYEKSWQSQEIWPQFHHFCYWELVWAHSILMNWKIAEEFAKKLFEESRWSKCIYAYMQASLLIMQRGEGSLTGPNIRRLTALMREVPLHKQRIAGKSIPMEKFVIKKSERFFAQNDRLCLPALELLYVWNFMRIIGKQWTLIENFYHLIERTLKDLERRTQDKYYMDDLALLILLKGCCLRSMGSPLQAEECFLAVLKLERNIQLDTYLVPFSVAELGFLYYTEDKIDEAVTWLEAAKNNYKGYSLESKLHFRVHSILSQIKVNGPPESADNPDNGATGLGLEDDDQNTFPDI